MKRHYMIPAPRKTVAVSRVTRVGTVAVTLGLPAATLSKEDFQRKFSGSAALLLVSVSYFGD